jgi:cell division protein FtsW (lipid II flippase)
MSVWPRSRPSGLAARNRELLALIPASLLLTAGFTAIFVDRSDLTTNASVIYGAVFLGLCVATHLVRRLTLPHADPYLFPLVALLACFGLVMIYRIDTGLAGQQAAWFVVGLIFFGAAIILLRHDYRVLERYRYTIAAVSIVLLILPRLPLIGSQTNGAFLGVSIGPITFQPAEFAKLGIVIFLASYLRDTRQLLVTGGRRVLGMVIPRLRDLGPLLVVWGAAMLMLVVIRDLGSSLMFYGAFVAILYVGTGRVSYAIVGVVLFAFGAWAIGTHVPHVADRVQTWLHPFNHHLYYEQGGSYQVAQSLFAQADGGLFGRGFGESIINAPSGGVLLPAPQTDAIYAVITDELGLFGSIGLLCIYLLIVQRAFKIAMAARDSFSTLLATGLGAVFALQVFVIVGGVTKVIPLTGVTLPFVSYGGSSIVANFVLLALLLLVSERARRPA